MRDLRGGRVRTALGCLVMSALVLTGCAEKEQASTSLPTTGAAPTTEALAEVGPPDMPMPSQAREQTAEGAQAFTEYYVEIYNHAVRNLDATYLRELSSACETCKELADQIEQVSADGQNIEGGEMSLIGSTQPYLTGDEAHLVFDIHQSPTTLLQDGVEADQFPQYETSGGGGVARWDEPRSTWVITQWTWQ